MPFTPSFLVLETCKRTSVNRPTGLKHALSHHPGAIDFLDRSAPTLRVAGLVAAQEQQLAAFPYERPLRWPRSTQLVAPATIKDGITAVTPEKAARPQGRDGAEFDYPVDE